MRGLARACALAALLVGFRAHAIEPATIAGTPLVLEITEASSISYNGDNRDSRPNQVSTRANDRWGVWYNRLNVQGHYGEWQLGLRLDTVWFYTAPEPVDIGLELERERAARMGESRAAYFQAKTREASLELSNRYIDWLYPAKYFVGYNTEQLELTAGDFYAQLGRGLVLSVRKLDELSSDTTVRGARATARWNAGPLRLRVTALGGSLNPLRIDDASGRYLSTTSEVTPSWLALAEAGMPRTPEYDTAAVRAGFLPESRATYAPDRVVAGQIELATSELRLGTQASVLVRQTPLSGDAVRSAGRVVTASQSLELPGLGEHGSVYLEVAAQRLEEQPESALDMGHAAYLSASVHRKPVTLTLEGKHYRRFFPLLGNVDIARAREFNMVQYSAPPTTEAFFVDTEFENFNTCVSGGRLRSDVSLDRRVNWFGWLGRYHSWAESQANPNCHTSARAKNSVWDAAAGFELTGRGRSGRLNATLGARDDRAARELTDALGNGTHVFYRELYVRYDWIAPLSGPWTIQLQGWHRRRRQTLGQAEQPWLEGNHLTGLEWGGPLSVALGVEYDTNPQNPDTYLNAQASYRLSSDSNVSLFVGQRRGALRCVGGVCRVFPPFEGARLDVTARF